MATKQIVQVFFCGCWEPVPGSYSFWVGVESSGYWVEDKDSNLVAFFSKKQTSAIRIIKE